MQFQDTAQDYLSPGETIFFLRSPTDSHPASSKFDMAFVQLQFLSQSNLFASSLSWKVLLSGLCVALVYLLGTNLRSYRRLSHIPGPFFAAVTNVQRMLWVKSNRAHVIHLNLHRKYGPIVRFGPNMISVADLKEIGTIYSFKKPWPKVRRSRVGRW